MDRARMRAGTKLGGSTPRRSGRSGSDGRGRRVLLSALLVWSAVLAGAGLASAAPGAFTDSAAFQSGVPGGTASVDFEALADGTDVSGTTQTVSGVGVTLPGPVFDVLDSTTPLLPLRIVVDAINNPATSGSKSLGVEDAKNFPDGLSTRQPVPRSASPRTVRR